jgi:hypothetical protein
LVTASPYIHYYIIGERAFWFCKEAGKHAMVILQEVKLQAKHFYFYLYISKLLGEEE